MKYISCFLTSFLLINTLTAQTSQDSVKLTISKLFNGMKNSDPVLLKSAFADSAILQSVAINKEGQTIIENESVTTFAATVSKLPKGDADERIEFDIIKIDGPLAIVWAPYTFYYKGIFSHCGTDSFQLIRINGQWKIQYLIDTRRKKGCNQ
jgi:hypothetical protein